MEILLQKLLIKIILCIICDFINRYNCKASRSSTIMYVCRPKNVLMNISLIFEASYSI